MFYLVKYLPSISIWQGIGLQPGSLEMTCQDVENKKNPYLPVFDSPQVNNIHL